VALQVKVAEVESKLAEATSLEARLTQAEVREVEAKMEVIVLQSNNSSLQVQLAGMRQQKQQLEEMLLFGGSGAWGAGWRPFENTAPATMRLLCIAACAARCVMDACWSGQSMGCLFWQLPEESTPAAAIEQCRVAWCLPH
jgi:hypothetical protein